MNERKRQEDLQRELAQSRERMSNCKHIFKDAIFDPETVKEGYGSVQDGAGSDPHWSFAGYRNIKKDRWSRECELCGKIEYTYTLEPNVVNYKPKF